jgi:hypothetical protein
VGGVGKVKACYKNKIKGKEKKSKKEKERKQKTRSVTCQVKAQGMRP